MTKTLSTVLIISLGMTLSIATSAQVPKKSVRLNLDTNIVNFNIGGWNPGGPEDWRLKKLEAGIGNPNLAVGVGVTVVDALAVGLKFSIAYETDSVSLDEDDSGLTKEEATTDFDAMKYTCLRWGVAPYLEYAFLDRVVRPFLMLLLGFEGHTDNAAYVTSVYWDFVLGLGGGIHFFANPSVSIDLTLLLGFSAGGGSIATEADDAETMKFTRILFRLTGGLGISGWF